MPRCGTERSEQSQQRGILSAELSFGCCASADDARAQRAERQAQELATSFRVICYSNSRLYPYTVRAAHTFILITLSARRQHVRRNRQADLLGGFQIDDELELLRLLDWKIRGLGAFEDLVHVGGGTTIQVK